MANVAELWWLIYLAVLPIIASGQIMGWSGGLRGKVGWESGAVWLGTEYVKTLKTGESPHGTLHAEMHWLLNVALSRSGKGHRNT